MPAPLLKAVCDVLRRDSRLGHGPTETINYLMDLLYYGDFAICEQVASTAHTEFVNLIGVKGPPGDAPPLWLLSCVASGTDPSPARWATTGGDPFGPRVDEQAGLVRGLGACSGKVDLVLKLLAASRIPSEELRRQVYVVALFGEEARGTGLRGVLHDHGQPGAVLMGAPTNLELWTDHPGCLILELALSRRVRHRRMPPSRGFFELRVPGRSAHAQAPGLGEDALSAGREVLDRLRAAGDVRILSMDAGEGANRVPGACRLVVATSYEDLPALPEGVEGAPLPDGASVPFPVDHLLEAWQEARDAAEEAISGGLASDRNAPAARPNPAVHTGSLTTGRDHVSGAVTLWTGPGVNVHDLVERFAEAVGRALSGREDVAVDIHVAQDRPALTSDESGGPLLDTARDALRRVGVPPVVSGGRVTTDGGMTAPLRVPTLAFGPGRGPADLYRDDEAIPLLHLEKALAFYEQMIRGWCCRT
ncbi:MAG: M20/M25/M40 family metallo-hydrolase [Myxococcota bacterium]